MRILNDRLDLSPEYIWVAFPVSLFPNVLADSYCMEISTLHVCKEHQHCCLFYKETLFLEQKPQQQNEEMKCFLQVEKMVAADWKRLGRHLGLEGYILEEIDADKKNVREKCACVLDKWKKLYGANIETLKEKLLEMGRRDVVNEIEGKGGSYSYTILNELI